MRKQALLVLFIIIGVAGGAQKDTSLLNRLNAVLSFTQVKDFEKVMDYTYPKLFTIAPRDLLIGTMKSSFETDEFTIELDSMKIDSIYPVFMVSDTSYVKVRHTMLMKMIYSESLDTTDREDVELLINLMGETYGKENVRFDVAANSMNILMRPVLVGIKESKSTPWTFINLNEDNPVILDVLFSKPVLARLREYN